MKLEQLTIGLKQPHSPPSSRNPYEAVLTVSHNDTNMKVKLSDDVCKRIIGLVVAQVQVSDFVKTALAVNAAAIIKGSAS